MRLGGAIVTLINFFKSTQDKSKKSCFDLWKLKTMVAIGVSHSRTVSHQIDLSGSGLSILDEKVQHPIK
jgi:hypothetical protein